MPRGYVRPIAEWTIDEFLVFMTQQCGSTVVAAITIAVH
jgi:hypothetical protein